MQRRFTVITDMDIAMFYVSADSNYIKDRFYN